MRLIDADYFKEQIAAATLKFDIEPNKGLALIELVDTQPTVNEWIPCRERMPEQPKYGEEDSYLVQQSNIEIPFSAYWNGECWTNDLSVVLDKIVAWQPLPEPYNPTEN